VNSGFADRGLTTWLPRRILPRADSLAFHRFYSVSRCQFSKTKRMSGRQLRMVPYNGNRAYKYNLDGYKVNGKRKRLFLRTKPLPSGNSQNLPDSKEKEGQDGLGIPLDLRVLAAAYDPTAEVAQKFVKLATATRVILAR
jgi:hypothetical protein